MAQLSTRVAAGWRAVAAAALVVTMSAPLWFASDAAAQAALPETAVAAPESTVLYHEIDLDREGAQWQQVEELLGRVGLPDALDMWEEELLAEGARKGDFTQADLDALFGGEMAITVSPDAVKLLATMHQGEHGMGEAMATPMADENAPMGVAAILLAGDADAAWAYAEGQLANYASRKNVELQTESHNGTDIIWIAGGMREHEEIDNEIYRELMGRHHRMGIATARAGDFIVVAPTRADVAAIIDTVDGANGSLADDVDAQAVRALLPADAISFTFIDGPAIVDAVGPEVIAQWYNMGADPAMAEESSRIFAGLTIGADDAGFRIDAAGMAGEGGNIDTLALPNDPSVPAAAEQAPADSVYFQAGLLPENALAGAAYMSALAVNGAFEEEDFEDGWQMQPAPTPDEIEAEIAQAEETLGFNLATDLFDILGGSFIVFSNLPDFMSGDFIPDAVAAIDTSDPARLGETTQKLVALAEQSGEDVAVSERTVGADTVYTVSSPDEAEIPGIDFGVVEGQLAVGIGSGVEDLVTAPDPALAGDPQYLEVMGHLPAEYSSVAYVNIGLVVDPLLTLFTMMEGSESGMAEATPVGPQAGPQNVRALAMVGYRDGDAFGSSAILYIAEAGS